MKEKIESLQNQVNSLQQKVIQLEAKFMTVEYNSKYALRRTKIENKTPFISQQYDSILERKKGFITLGKISEEEKIEIIQLGFQLQAVFEEVF